MRFRWIGGAALAALAVVDAHAELGGNIATVQADQVHMKASLRVLAATANTAYTTHEITTEFGVVIREYADTNGTVFAVTWSGPAKPDLQQLLGQYFAPFVRARAQSSHVGTGPLALSAGDLVVYSGGHPRAFNGRAYVLSLVPQGVSVDVLP